MNTKKLMNFIELLLEMIFQVFFIFIFAGMFIGNILIFGFICYLTAIGTFEPIILVAIGIILVFNIYISASLLYLMSIETYEGIE